MRVDQDLRVCGWRWSSCPHPTINNWVEGWVWWHGEAPHAPLEFRHQRGAAGPYTNEVQGPHGTLDRTHFHTLEDLQESDEQDPRAQQLDEFVVENLAAATGE